MNGCDKYIKILQLLKYLQTSSDSGISQFIPVINFNKQNVNIGNAKKASFTHRVVSFNNQHSNPPISIANITPNKYSIRCLSVNNT